MFSTSLGLCVAHSMSTVSKDRAVSSPKDEPAALPSDPDEGEEELEEEELESVAGGEKVSTKRCRSLVITIKCYLTSPQC